MLYGLLLLVHFAGAALLSGGGLVTLLLMQATARNLALSAAFRLSSRIDALIFGLGLLIQPISGLGLAHVTGFSLGETWIGFALALYTVSISSWFIGLGLRNEGLNLSDPALPLIGNPRIRWGLRMSTLALFTITGALAVMVLKP